jgi:hypothetical protein
MQTANIRMTFCFGFRFNLEHDGLLDRFVDDMLRELLHDFRNDCLVDFADDAGGHPPARIHIGHVRDVTHNIVARHLGPVGKAVLVDDLGGADHGHVGNGAYDRVATRHPLVLHRVVHAYPAFHLLVLELFLEVSQVRPEARVALSGGPHLFVDLMKYECVVGEGLDHPRTIQRQLPLHSHGRIPEIPAKLVCRNTLLNQK